MERVRELWRLRTGSVVTERLRNTDLHKEVTRKKLGEIDPAKSSANSRLNGEITWKGRKIHDYLNNVARICPKREENLEGQKNDESISFKSLDGPKWPYPL